MSDNANCFREISIRMAKAKCTKKKENLRRSKRSPKKPDLQSSQDCVLFSTSKAKSRGKKKVREQWADRQRKARQRKREIEVETKGKANGKAGSSAVKKTTKKKK